MTNRLNGTDHAHCWATLHWRVDKRPKVAANQLPEFKHSTAESVCVRTAYYSLMQYTIDKQQYSVKYDHELHTSKSVSQSNEGMVRVNRHQAGKRTHHDMAWSCLIMGTIHRNLLAKQFKDLPCASKSQFQTSKYLNISNCSQKYKIT